MTTKSDVAASLSHVLLRSRNSDGGWGYYAGKLSRLEPTCWALLALGPEADDRVLRNWPLKDGLLIDPGSPTPNYGFHGLAILTLLGRRVEHAASNRKLIAALESAKGVALPNRGASRMRTDLQAWSWIEGTFSWAEPTAWCVLTLKKARDMSIPVSKQRIVDGDLVLFDRYCQGGGWNFGTSNVLGKQLQPYVSSTALALLALQDHPTHEAVNTSLDLLQREWHTEPSGLALGLSAVSLRHFNIPISPLLTTLEKAAVTTLFLGNLHSIAVAAYAFRAEQNDFKL